IGDLAWSEIDLAKRQIEIPGSRTKNHLPHIIPLSDEAIALLPEQSDERDLVFGVGAGGFGGGAEFKGRLAAPINEVPKGKPIRHWTQHDLRRTFVTQLNELGGSTFAQPHVIEAIVNHVSGGAKAGVAGVYNKAQYLPERRKALEWWGAHIARLVSQSEPARPAKPKRQC